jgi:hypothetical protein
VRISYPRNFRAGSQTGDLTVASFYLLYVRKDVACCGLAPAAGNILPYIGATVGQCYGRRMAPLAEKRVYNIRWILFT